MAESQVHRRHFRWRLLGFVLAGMLSITLASYLYFKGFTESRHWDGVIELCLVTDGTPKPVSFSALPLAPPRTFDNPGWIWDLQVDLGPNALMRGRDKVEYDIRRRGSFWNRDYYLLNVDHNGQRSTHDFSYAGKSVEIARFGEYLFRVEPRPDVVRGPRTTDRSADAN